MDWLLKKVTSKKLWAFLIAVGIIYTAAQSGNIAWAVAMPLIRDLALYYLGAEGLVDISRAIPDILAGRKK